MCMYYSLARSPLQFPQILTQRNIPVVLMSVGHLESGMTGQAHLWAYPF